MKRLYDHDAIEKKWRARWEKEKLYEVDPAKAENPFYCLDMFPYPSGDGLHVGHWRGYILSDFYARLQRLKGKTVLHPMGFDSFGLPAENAAIKHKSHPKKFTDEAIKNFSRQLQEMGAAFDWEKQLVTSDPTYYRWTQWLFLQFFKHGLAEKRLSLVNWCPKDQTVLANEQVVDGCCERCGSKVTKKELAQWYLKTTAFAEELALDLEKVNWPEHVKSLQRNWIGRSEGAEVAFVSTSGDIRVFTTRPDTLFGVTALVLAPEHPLAEKLVTTKNRPGFAAYQKQVAAKTNVDRAQGKESAKTAFFTGSYATHPLTEEKLPIWLADYVLMDYGTGAVMSVPAHDERDFQFAKAHNLPIKQVIMPSLTDQTNPPQKGKQDTERKVVLVILYDPKSQKYLTLKWKTQPWTTFITGGVEEGEEMVEAAKREIAEETGYSHLKLVRSLGITEAFFFAAHKDVNRKTYAEHFLFELIDETQKERAAEEINQYDLQWLRLDELKKTNLQHAEAKLLITKLETGVDCYSEEGVLINSGEFDTLTSPEAAEKIVAKLEKLKQAKKETSYRLRDWLVSRQRYWGAPIPIVYDPEGQAHAVKDEHLPLELPTDVDFLPGGQSPIARSKEYVELAEKRYGKGWRFETDTLDTFVDSSWYFLRYLSPNDQTQPFQKELVKKWLPIDLYIGHNVPHLLYARFVTKFLARYGYIDQAIDEPIKQLFDIGMVTLHGAKMSKSKGNVVSPDTLIEHYGTDALRGYELFIGPMDIEAEWNSRGINGVHRFLIKVYKLAEKALGPEKDPTQEQELGRYLKNIEEMTDSFRLNTYVSEAMKLVNGWEKKTSLSRELFGQFLITLSPIFPFLSEELWEQLGNKETIFKASWPKMAVVAGVAEITVLIDQKFVDRFVPSAESEAEVIEEAKKRPLIAQKLQNQQKFRVVYKAGKMLNIITKG